MSDPARPSRGMLTAGQPRAAARAMLKAVGFTDDDLRKPLIGIANTWIEIGPCNYHLRDLAAHVKHGIREAGGTPMEFNTVSISDGITMGTDRHARVAGEPRGDRRFDRARRARQRLRRPRRPRRLRQDDSRRRDGARAARTSRASCSTAGRSRRATWTGATSRSRTCSRRRRARSGDARRRRPAPARGRRVPGRWRLRRPVHGEHDGRRLRVPRHVAARQCAACRPSIRPRRAWPTTRACS